MSNNQNQQGGVPDYRIQEMQEQLRKLADENRQLRGTIDTVYANQMQRQQPQPTDEKPLFEPQIENALEKKIKKMVDPVAAKYQQQIGMLYDRNDQMDFQLRYGADTYQKYADKIEAIRQQNHQQGRWVSREEAYKLAHFEETNRKPKQNPHPGEQRPTGPTFDPYTGMMIQAPQAVQPQAPAPQPAAPQQPGQQPQQVQAQPQQQPQAPLGQEDFGLPADMVAPQSGAPTAPSQGLSLSVPDEKGLTAFLDKYGDVPL